jgi:hypothetical protein
MAHFQNKGNSSAKDVYTAITPSTANFSRKDLVTGKPISTRSDGRIICISSPLDDSGYFYELFETAMGGGPAAENMLAIQAPCWEINENLPPETLKSFYYKSPASFMVEYGAQFSGRTTKFIENKEDLLNCIVPSLRPKPHSMDRSPHYLGADIGLVTDGSAVSITHVEGSDIILDYHETRYAGHGDFQGFSRLDIEDHVIKWIAELANRFYIVEGIFDQWSGIGIEQLLAKRGYTQFKSEFMGKEMNSRLYQNFLTLMYMKRLKLFDYPLPRDPKDGDHSQLVAELLDLRKELHAKNMISVFAPQIVGKHDDASDSLVRSVWLASASLREGSTEKRSATSVGKRSANASCASALQKSFNRRREMYHGTHPRALNRARLVKR